ncbi:hypothetical protein [Opitutus sp. ER46]|uniref:hypothetical protein n=1 Tax=Opitutus sp. ER46 TaxID=2161864 RepID=UPI000D30D4E2|nr:hypothetical protein [Opitutus sp. ER46]PTX98905.1 hypothetical protein DB354_02445 [Opitutus sp. ER46]
MPAAARLTLPDRLPTLANASFALGLIVLGVRLALFGYAGSPLPYYDQWLAEFNNTLLPATVDGPSFALLFTPHNEHILATTKLLSLLGVGLNGYWDVPFLAAIAALVRAIEAVLTFRVLSFAAARGVTVTAWLGCLVVFATPLSGYNLLSGLQVSFYLSDLALLGSLLCVARWQHAGRNGAALALLTLFGLSSMGAAIAIPAATLATHLASPRHRPGFWTAWILSATAAGAYALWAGAGVGIRTAGLPLAERAAFLLQLLGWPSGNVLWGAAILFGVIAGVLWLWRTQRRAAAALPLGLATYAAANLAMLAWRRPPSDFHARHFEIAALLPLGVMVLAASLAYVTSPSAPDSTAPATSHPSPGTAPHRASRRLLVPLAALYLCALVSVWLNAGTYLVAAHAHRAEAVAHYRALLTSPRMQQARVEMNERLRALDYRFFDDPILRFTPHPTVYGNILVRPLSALALLAPEILPSRPPSVTSRVVRVAFAAGPWLAVLGALLAAAVALKSPARRPLAP